METLQHASPRTSGLGSFSLLPDEMVSYVLGYADVPSLSRLCCTSQMMRVYSLEEPLWKLMCLKYNRGLLEYQGNWRQTALRTMKCVPDAAVEAALKIPKPVPGLNSMFLHKRWLRCHMDLRGFLPFEQGIQRLSADSLSPGSFLHMFDFTCTPVLLQNTVSDQAAQGWSLDRLCRDFGERIVGVSKPVTGKLPMRFSAYLGYMQQQCDEEPLYVFDEHFGERMPELLGQYSVPHVFDQDYLQLLGSNKRPPYRWLVLGPARSGAAWHIDPGQTSAWNTLISGAKRWALYPAGHIPPGVRLRVSGNDVDTCDQLSALQWFLEVYPCLEPQHRPPIEFVQQPGETVFVPGGWWHTVLNIEASIAVTQNFVSDANLQRVLHHMGAGGLQTMRMLGQLPATVPLEAESSDSDSDSESGTDWDTDMEPEPHQEQGSSHPDSHLPSSNPYSQPGSLNPNGLLTSSDPNSHQKRPNTDRYLGSSNHPGSSEARDGGGGAAWVDYEQAGIAGLGSSIRYLRVGVKGEVCHSMRAALRGRGLARRPSLARLLHLMWRAFPQHQPLLDWCAHTFLATPSWRQMLGAICTHLGIPVPTATVQLVPLVSSAGLVFLGPWHVIKIMAHSVPHKAHLMTWLEAHLSASSLPSLKAIGVSSPEPLAVGHILLSSPPSSPTAPLSQASSRSIPQPPTKGPPQSVPFIMLSRVGGDHAQPFALLLSQLSVSSQHMLSQRLGRLAAAIHSLPLPVPQQPVPGGVNEGEGVNHGGGFASPKAGSKAAVPNAARRSAATNGGCQSANALGGNSSGVVIHGGCTIAGVANDGVSGGGFTDGSINKIDAPNHIHADIGITNNVVESTGVRSNGVGNVSVADGVCRSVGGSVHEECTSQYEQVGKLVLSGGAVWQDWCGTVWSCDPTGELLVRAPEEPDRGNAPAPATAQVTAEYGANIFGPPCVQAGIPASRPAGPPTHGPPNAPTHGSATPKMELAIPTMNSSATATINGLAMPTVNATATALQKAAASVATEASASRSANTVGVAIVGDGGDVETADGADNLVVIGRADGGILTGPGSAGRRIPDGAVPWMWRPFVAFLRARHEQVLQEMEEVRQEGGLVPDWVASQVQAFLPSDPATLVLGQDLEMPHNPVPPCWLHNDIASNNILISSGRAFGDVRQTGPRSTAQQQRDQDGTRDTAEQQLNQNGRRRTAERQIHQVEHCSTAVQHMDEQFPQEKLQGYIQPPVPQHTRHQTPQASFKSNKQQQLEHIHAGSLAGWHADEHAVSLSVLDFADAGIGDPLFDLVALHISCFKFDPMLLREFVCGYRATASPGAKANWVARGGLKLSYVAMCYMLLHEEGVVDLFHKPSQLCFVADSLKGLCTELWGVLDE